MLFVLSLQHHVKTGVLNRIAAKAVDLMIVVAWGALLPYPLGPLLGFFYSWLGDGMNFGPFKGQSLGKKLFKLQVVNLDRQGPGSLKDSALRNAPVAVATFFAIIPVWGWVILGLVGLPLLIMEIYLMVSVDKGHRLGDVMGDTEVIDLREPASWPG